MKKGIKKLNDLLYFYDEYKIKPISIEQFFDIFMLTLVTEQIKGKEWVAKSPDIQENYVGRGKTQLQAITNFSEIISGKKINVYTNHFYCFSGISVPKLIALGHKGYVNKKKRL